MVINKTKAVAVETDLANEQHYEVPTEFFREVLGTHMKYSACYWQQGVDELDTAERDALATDGTLSLQMTRTLQAGKAHAALRDALTAIGKRLET